MPVSSTDRPIAHRRRRVARSALAGLAALGLAGTGCSAAQRQDVAPLKLNQPPTPEASAVRSPAPAPASARNEPVSSGAEPVLIGDWPDRGTDIDLDEHGAEVREVLQKIARPAKLNFVVQDEVRGRITASFKQVPWSQALEAILRTRGLVAVREGNVVRVLPVEDWRREQTGTVVP